MKSNQIKNNKLNEWQKIRLKECLLEKPDYGINAASVEFSDDLPAYLRITDISEDGNLLSIKKTSVDNPNSHKYILNEGDVVVARTGASVGKTYSYKKNDGKLVFAGFLIRMRSDKKKLNSEFLSAYTHTNKYFQWVKETSTRSGQPGINSVEIGNLAVLLPLIPEQNRIVSVLKTWDKVIEKLTKKIVLKKNIKKGLMKRLLTGELRLAGFSEPWNYIKIKNLAGLVKGDKSKGGDDGYLEIGDVDINSKNYNIVGKEKLTVPGAIKVPRGTLLISTVRPTRGAITITKESIFVSSAFCKLKIDDLFIYFIVNSETFLNYLGDSSGGGTYPTCKNEDVLEYEFLAPVVVEERIAVANILKTAEQEIEVLEKKLTILKEQKNYLLNNLITGAIRTPETMKIKS